MAQWSRESIAGLNFSWVEPRAWCVYLSVFLSDLMKKIFSLSSVCVDNLCKISREHKKFQFICLNRFTFLLKLVHI